MAGCLEFSAMAGPDNVAQTNNPYASIVSRNVFSLSAASAPAPETPTPDGPLPKITLEGITSILGDWLVLFKVGEVNPAGAVMQEKACMLKEGETDDGVKVVSIIPADGIVMFDNHGRIQQFTLPHSTKLPVYMARRSYADTLPKSYPPEFIRARTPDYLGGGPDGSSNGGPITNLQDRITLIEAQRAYLKDNNDPAANLLPPTAATPEDAYSSKSSAPNQASQQK